MLLIGFTLGNTLDYIQADELHMKKELGILTNSQESSKQLKGLPRLQPLFHTCDAENINTSANEREKASPRISAIMFEPPHLPLAVVDSA